MNYEEIMVKAELENGSFNAGNSTRIYIGSAAGNNMTEEVFKSFQVAIDEAGLRAEICMTGSFGYYDLEPMVLIRKRVTS